MVKKLDVSSIFLKINFKYQLGKYSNYIANHSNCTEIFRMNPEIDVIFVDFQGEMVRKVALRLNTITILLHLRKSPKFPIFLLGCSCNRLLNSLLCFLFCRFLKGMGATLPLISTCIHILKITPRNQLLFA